MKFIAHKHCTLWLFILECKYYCYYRVNIYEWAIVNLNNSLDIHHRRKLLISLESCVQHNFLACVTLLTIAILLDQVNYLIFWR